MPVVVVQILRSPPNQFGRELQKASRFHWNFFALVSIPQFEETYSAKIGHSSAINNNRSSNFHRRPAESRVITIKQQ
ncbi:Hypothetical predicted protein [Cloeon dipterum]|uniref:Uncharacterized protein n=1 Tax=Cloeon dipterum TaxID=197152 RepID=A0A8S1DNY0_9INSE|nr:Hypothetical predicted protein [Cloeon dipterum]